MTLRIRSGAASDVGRVRSVNQDSLLVLADRGLFVVADGMGGHQGGEVASQLAVEVLRASFVDATADALAEAIADANERIFDAGEADPDLRGMGTTLVAAAILPDQELDGVDAEAHVLVANVGDSRAYLFRGGDLTQLTEDHSMVADLLREGRISEEEAEVHPQRNIVTRVLGVYDTVDVDLWPVDAVRGDRLLLCSDGLFNEVAPDQIAAVLRRLDDPQDAASELVRRANEGGGRDNVTVVVLDVIDDGGVAEAASAALGQTEGASGRSDPAGPADAAAAAASVGTAATGRFGRGRKGRRDRSTARERSDRPKARRLTWRSVLFVLAVLAVIGGALATIQWYGTSTYYVGFDSKGIVTIYRGRPGGVLWIDPKPQSPSTGINRNEVPATYRPALDEGHEVSTREQADAYVFRIEKSTFPTTTTTTTTTTPGGRLAPPTPTATSAHP
jgi:serine/threonine protein phosphatase PrpC